MKTQLDRILQDSEIKEYIELLESKEYKVSDIIQEMEGKTLQYIDIVMEGGGVLGIALLGYIFALEKAGIRFLSIGGTSAGAITALMLMAADRRDEPKSDKLINALFNMEIEKFIDGKKVERDLSYALGRGKVKKISLRLIWQLFRVRKTLFKEQGLNPGNKFSGWVEGVLKEFKVSENADLKKMTAFQPEGLKNRLTGELINEVLTELKIVTTELSSESKIIFPQDAGLFWSEPAEVNPAKFVRASMSIPLFFQPMKVSGVDRIPNSDEKWAERFPFGGEVPATAVFADGGVLSNFPINLFHETGKVPLAPTFGVKLGKDYKKRNKIENIFHYLFSLFNTAQSNADNEFILAHKDYKHLISHIDTSGHHWLNFFMDEKDKIDLFKRGVKRAYKFLETFNWKNYKNIRKEIYQG